MAGGRELGAGGDQVVMNVDRRGAGNEFQGPLSCLEVCESPDGKTKDADCGVVVSGALSARHVQKEPGEGDASGDLRLILAGLCIRRVAGLGDDGGRVRFSLLHRAGGLLLVGIWFGYRLVNIPQFADFLIAVEAEMNKVSWPSRAELVRSSVVVIFVIFLLASVLFAYDLIWRSLFVLIGVRPS